MFKATILQVLLHNLPIRPAKLKMSSFKPWDSWQSWESGDKTFKDPPWLEEPSFCRQKSAFRKVMVYLMFWGVFVKHPRTNRTIHDAGTQKFMKFNKSHKLHKKIFKRKLRSGMCRVRSSSVRFLPLSLVWKLFAAIFGQWIFVNSSLIRYLLTSWQPAWQSSLFN